MSRLGNNDVSRKKQLAKEWIKQECHLNNAIMIIRTAADVVHCKHCTFLYSKLSQI